MILLMTGLLFHQFLLWLISYVKPSRQMDVFLFWAETVQTANTNSNVDKITLLIIFWNFIYSKNTCFV